MLSFKIDFWWIISNVKILNIKIKRLIKTILIWHKNQNNEMKKNCVCVFMFVCECAYACMHVEARGQLQCSLPIIFRQVLSWTWGLLIQQATEILLPLPPYWDYRHVSLYSSLSSECWGSELRSSCLGSKHFTNWILSPVYNIKMYVGKSHKRINSESISSEESCIIQ